MKPGAHLKDIADQAFEELRAVRTAQHHFQGQISRAVRYARRADPSISALVVQVARLTRRVEELEARQRRRDEASERMWRKPVGETA